MAYQQNNFKKNNNNRQEFPKNKKYTFNIKLTGTTANGRDYNIQSALDVLNLLEDHEVFKMLSVPAQISRAIFDNNSDARGNINVGFVTGTYAVQENPSIDVMVYGRNVEKMDKIADGLEVVPRMMVDKEGFISTILSFDIVNA